MELIAQSPQDQITFQRPRDRQQKGQQQQGQDQEPEEPETPASVKPVSCPNWWM
jgi:hypothetical protein